MRRALALWGIIFVGIFSGKVFSQIRICAEPPQVNVSKKGGANGVFEYNNTWPDGATINVSFKDNYPGYITGEIKKYAVEWENYANIHFAFVPYSPSTDVLIELSDDNASWSYIGKDCLNYSRSGKPSMHYGWFTANTADQEYKRTVLHEFGHTLGLCHEHQNPMGSIHWNKDAVYGYYCEKMQPPWPKEKVDENIFDKLTVGISNRAYDPTSIMHYPIPKEFTTDGFSVGWNYDLSAGDKAIIAEMYPGTSVSKTNDGSVSAAFDSISVKHNVVENGENGMVIRPYFTVNNALHESCIIAGYFEDAVKGTPLKDKNGRYTTTDGNVAVNTTITPGYQNTQFSTLDLFIPYDEFDLGYGEFKLRFRMILWHDSKQVLQSGYVYFTYTNGPVSNNIEIKSTIDNPNHQFRITPKFIVKNAKDLQCQAYVYFQINGEYLKNTSGGILTYASNFRPGYDPAYYNFQDQPDLSFLIDFNDLNLPQPPFTLRYFVNLDIDNRAFAISPWNEITFSNSSQQSNDNSLSTSVGTYKIRNASNSGYLNNAYGGDVCGTIDPQWTGAQWELIKLNDLNTYLFKNAYTQSYLSLSNGVTTELTTPTVNSQWIFQIVPNSGNAYWIKNITGNAYLKNQNGLLMITNISAQDPSGQWYFEKQN